MGGQRAEFGTSVLGVEFRGRVGDMRIHVAVVLGQRVEFARGVDKVDVHPLFKALVGGLCGL